MRKLIVLTLTIMLAITASANAAGNVFSTADKTAYASPNNIDLKGFPLLKKGGLTLEKAAAMKLHPDTLQEPVTVFNFNRSLDDGRFVLETLSTGTNVWRDENDNLVYKASCDNRIAEYRNCPVCPDPTTIVPQGGNANGASNGSNVQTAGGFNDEQLEQLKALMSNMTGKDKSEINDAEAKKMLAGMLGNNPNANAAPARPSTVDETASGLADFDRGLLWLALGILLLLLVVALIAALVWAILNAIRGRHPQPVQPVGPGPVAPGPVAGPAMPMTFTMPRGAFNVHQAHYDVVTQRVELEDFTGSIGVSDNGNGSVNLDIQP